MRRAAVGALVVGLALLVLGPAGAQEPSLRVEVFDTADYPRVQLTVSTPPALAGFEIPPEDFTVVEGVAAVDATITRLPTEGLDVALLIDTSGSMAGEALAEAQQAAVTFVEQMPPGVEVALVGFGEEAEVVSPLTQDRAELIEAIGTLRSRGETALYDGLVTATGVFAASDNARRVVVMLSDGGDTVSAGSLEDAIVAVLDAEATFYAVELQTAENDSEPLERLGAAADGEVVAAGDPEALDAIFTEIAAALVSRYEIEFGATQYGPTRLVVTVDSAAGSASLVRVVRFPDPPPPPAPPPAEEPVAVPEAPPARLAPAPLTVPDYEPLPTVVVEPGPLSSGAVLAGGLVAVFLALASLAFYTARGGARVRLVASDARKMMKTRRGTLLSNLTERAAEAAEHTLDRRGRRGQLERALEAAGLTLRSGEFVVLVAGSALAAYASGTVVAGPAVGLVLAVAAIAGFWLGVQHKVTKRRATFADQLMTTLQLMSSSLRAGFGLLQAIDVVAEEARSPTADEFHRVKVEVHLGRDLDDALEAMAERVGGEDMMWVAEGIAIHREVGGDLSEIIDGVAHTIRERNRLRRQVKALSAEGRYSAVILVALPFAMAAFLAYSNPDYLSELFKNESGRTALAVGAVLLVAGIGWMRKLIKLDY